MEVGEFMQSGGGFLDTPLEDEQVTIGSTDEASYLEEAKGEAGQENQQMMLSKAVTMVNEKFTAAKDGRRTDETRWIKAYNNYRGVYNSDTMFTSKEKSKIFIKVTKTKVLAAYAQITEVLFSGTRFPIGIQAVRHTKDVANKVTVKKNAKPPEEQGPRIPTSRKDIIEKISDPLLKTKLDAIKDNVVEGSQDAGPEDVVIEPNARAALAMDGKIQDQLQEADANKATRSFCFELALFGHGILKGPLGQMKDYPRWSTDGTYQPRQEFIPRLDHVSLWDFYPDPDGKSIETCDYVIERHRMQKSQLRKFKKQPNFMPESIQRAIDAGANFIPEYWEHSLEDNQMSKPDNRYEVLEYWGYASRDEIEDVDGFEIPESMESVDDFQVNIWVCNNYVLKVVLNPFTPSRTPYHSCPYEHNPYSFFGIGVAENMEDTQLVMNGFMRLMVDNASISSNLIFEIDEGNLTPGQNMELYPGKIFRRMGGAPGQAIFSHKPQNVTNEILMAFDKARQLADEATGLPSYSHGMSGVMSTGRTASGMSMLMGAAAQNIKSVIRNIDDFLLVPLGKHLLEFNMQFNFDKDWAYEMEVVAKGTDSLMRNEVRSQKLLQFLQLTANQLDAPFTKRPYLLEELAMSLDLDPELVVNNTKEALIQAVSISKMNKMMGVETNLGGQAGLGGGTPQPQGGEQGGMNPAVPQEPGAQGNSAPGNPFAGGQASAQQQSQQ